jgi:polar amino acid transport system substrate-binding protein
MKTAIKLFLMSFSIILFSCGGKNSDITTLKMLEGGKTFAVPTGTAADQLVKKRFPEANLIYLNTVLDCALAVKKGKADAAAYDLPVLKNIAAKNEGLTVLREVILEDHYGFAVTLGNDILKATADSVIDDLRANGTYQEMMNRWFPENGPPADMPNITFDKTDSVLRFGTAAVTEPMSFINGRNSMVGFDIELASYIAKRLHKKLEVIDFEFGAMIPALVSGKVDMIGAGLSITEERAKSVLFTKSYYEGGLCALVRGSSKRTPAETISKLSKEDDIKDKRIGVLLGSIHDSYATKKYPDAKILEYQNISDMLLALNSDKVDVVFYDEVSLQDVFEKNAALGTLQANVFSVPIAAGFNEESSELRKQFNSFLNEIKTNGVYNDMVDRWMKKRIATMPDIPCPPDQGTLKVGVVGDLGMPFTFLQDGELVGFDIELSTRFAQYIHKEFVPVEMPFGSLLASISTHKIDVITASMMVTEEREKQIDFSVPYFESGVSIIAQKAKIAHYEGMTAADDPAKAGDRSFFTKIGNSFYNNIIHEKRYLLILDGLVVTIIISIFAALFGTLFGGLVCYCRMSKNKYLNIPAKLYITLLRGLPVLVLLMIIYYIVFASLNINPVIVAILAFGFNFAAYVSEMFRTSIQSIDKGQTEAGIAGGFTRVQTFIYIILPQAVRRVLPVYKGEFISLVKMTSIVGYIAVQDLTKAGDIIRSRTFDAFFPLIMAAVIYLILAWLLTVALNRIEISVDPRHNSIKRGMEVKK